MLDDLISCIETLKDRIKSHGTSLRENEIRTRIQLIDPLLRVLGWDVSDPAIVVPEYKVKDDRADYALLQPGGGLAAFIEAKKLNTILDPHQSQMVKYALMDGIKHVGLTDGNRWEFYDLLQPVGMDEKQVLGLSIADTPSHECALKLLLLWRPNLSSGSPLPANAPLMAITDDVSSTAIDPPDADNWVSLAEYISLPQTQLPNSIRFWDGEVQPMKYWYELVYLTAEKLYQEGAFQVHDTPIKLVDYPNDPRSFRYSIHEEPKHSNGDDFTSPRTIGDPPLYVETADNRNAHTRKAVTLLKMYNKDPSDVHLNL